MLKKIDKKIYFISLVVVCILMYIFANSFYWPEEGLMKRKIVTFGLIVFSIIIIPIVMSTCEWCKNVIRLMKLQMQKFICIVKIHKTNIIKYLIMCVLTIAISYPITIVICKILKLAFNIHLMYMLIVLFNIFILAFLLRNCTKEKPEILFLVIVLLTGSLFIKVCPPVVGISWDDEIHYERTLNLSNCMNGIMYTADRKMIDEYASNVWEQRFRDRDSRAAYEAELDKIYYSRQYSRYVFSNIDITYVAYIPSAIGIIIGRGLTLSYEHIFMLGKFFNLLMYSILFYFAIKKLKFGKVFLAFIGLIPTTVFMACSYSYDSWVIGFTALGFSYLFNAYQSSDYCFNNRDLIIMVISFVLGCLPKAIYFPLLLPMLFISKEKFKNEKQRKIFKICAIVAICILIASFLLPLVMSGGGNQSDSRGGDNVNSAEQISFILHHPLTYTFVLLNFLKTYLSLDSTTSYLQLFAYLKADKYYLILLVSMFLLAFLDKSSYRKNDKLLLRVSTYFGIACICALVPTALYIAFTAVASDTIAGCQVRYLLPVVYPALYLMGPDGTTIKMDRRLLVNIPLIIISLVFLVNMTKLCILYY